MHRAQQFINVLLETFLKYFFGLTSQYLGKFPQYIQISTDLEENGTKYLPKVIGHCDFTKFELGKKIIRP